MRWLLLEFSPRLRVGRLRWGSLGCALRSVRFVGTPCVVCLVRVIRLRSSVRTLLLVGLRGIGSVSSCCGCGLRRFCGLGWLCWLGWLGCGRR